MSAPVHSQMAFCESTVTAMAGKLQTYGVAVNERVQLKVTLELAPAAMGRVPPRSAL